MKQIFLGLSLFILLNPTCFAEGYEKNGFPCVAELCVGDGLSELKNIQWQVVNVDTGKLDNAYGAQVKSRYRGNISERLIPYLAVEEKFDGVALPLLSGVSARCQNDSVSLRGEYTTKSGNRTKVSIRLTPKAEGSTEQQWTVMWIQRTVASPSMSPQEVEAAKQQLSERYAKIDRKKGKFGFEKGSGYFYFDLTHSAIYDKLDSFPPQCVNKISMD